MRPRWSSRSVGSRLQHRIFYLLIRRLGTTGGYCLLFFVISWYVARSSVRDRSKAYIRRRFSNPGVFAYFFHTWKLQWAFGQCLVDRAAAGILGGFSFDAFFEETLRLAADEAKGIILLAAHTGCWQMSPYALAEHARLPVAVLAHKEHGDVDRQAHEHAGTAPPFQVVHAGTGVAASVELVKRLRQGELVCMMGDRMESPTEPSAPVMFLGGTVPAPIAAYRLASATGAPVACAFALRTGPRRGKLCIAHIMRVPEGLGANARAYIPYAQRFASALECFVRDHPYQFFNFYDFWE